MITKADIKFICRSIRDGIRYSLAFNKAMGRDGLRQLTAPQRDALFYFSSPKEMSKEGPFKMTSAATFERAGLNIKPITEDIQGNMEIVEAAERRTHGRVLTNKERIYLAQRAMEAREKGLPQAPRWPDWQESAFSSLPKPTLLQRVISWFKS